MNNEFDLYRDFTLFMANNNICLTYTERFPNYVLRMYVNEKIRELVSVLYSRVKKMEDKIDDH